MIQMVNNYNKEVFNGDIGRITHIDLDEGVLSARFNGREIEYDFGELDEIVLAYACSIHKSQGSEFPAVVVPLATSPFANTPSRKEGLYLNAALAPVGLDWLVRSDK
ncbi:MAG: ATP-binding domain-containing protein [Chromatiales bacterium]